MKANFPQYVLLTVLVIAVCWNQSGGQNSKEKSAALVGMINIGRIAEESQQRKDDKEERERILAPLKKEAQTLKADLDKWRSMLEKATDKKKLEEKIQAGRRRTEDLEREAHRLIHKKQDAQTTAFKKELEETAKVYAEAHGFSFIVGVDVPGGSTSLYVQGLDIAFLSPVYVHPRLDLTEPILDKLNLRYLERKGGQKK